MCSQFDRDGPPEDVGGRRADEAAGEPTHQQMVEAVPRRRGRVSLTDPRPARRAGQLSAWRVGLDGGRPRNRRIAPEEQPDQMTDCTCAASEPEKGAQLVDEGECLGAGVMRANEA